MDTPRNETSTTHPTDISPTTFATPTGSPTKPRKTIPIAHLPPTTSKMHPPSVRAPAQNAELLSAISSLADRVEQLALGQQELSQRFETERPLPPPPRESTGSNSQVTAMQEAITTLAETIKHQQASQFFGSSQSAQSAAKEEAQTLAALLKAAPTFQGDAGEYYQYKHGMNNFLARRVVTEELKVEVILGSLEDDAKVFSLGIDMPPDVNSLWEELDARFGEPEDARLEALKGCTQGAQQTIRQYCDAMQKLAYEVPISVTQLKQLFIAGLHNASAYAPHLTANINTFADLKDLSAQAQRYARAYKAQPKPASRPPYSNTKRAVPPRRPAKPAAKPANEVITEDPECHHMDLEDQFNAELEVGEHEMEACPAEKRGPSSNSDDVMNRLATETGQNGQPGSSAPPTKRFRTPAASGKAPAAGPGRPPKEYKTLTSVYQLPLQVPACTTNGLVLKAAKNPQAVVNQWIKAAEYEIAQQESGSSGAMVNEGEIMMTMNQINVLGQECTLAVNEGGWDSEEEDDLRVVNPIVQNQGQAAERKNMLFCPVQFPDSQKTWWCMVDTGAECSIISSGLVGHLKLLEMPGTTIHASDFSVSGYDKGAARKMPIIATWMRMGTRGDDLRWERVMFVVLPSKEYKLLLGMDFLDNRNGVVEARNRKLFLEKEGIKYVLPLMEKRYVLRSQAIQAYQRAEGQSGTRQGNAIEVNEVLQTGAIEQVANALDEEELSYVKDASLVDILRFQKMSQEQSGEKAGDLACQQLKKLAEDKTLTRREHRLARQALSRATRHRQKQGNEQAPHTSGM